MQNFASPVSTITTGAGAVLWTIGGLHVYWLCGGSHAKAAVIPTRDGAPVLSPGPVSTAAVASLLAAAGTLYIGRAAEWRPSWVFRSGTMGAAAVLLLRAVGDGRTVGFAKRIRNTPFARLDTAVFSPLCAVLGTTGMIAALRHSRSDG